MANTKNRVFISCGTLKDGKYFKSVEEAKKKLGFCTPKGDVFSLAMGEMVKLNEDWYVLDGWDGEAYCRCYRLKDLVTFGDLNKHNYKIYLVFQGLGEPAEDGDFASYEIIGYKVCY